MGPAARDTQIQSAPASGDGIGGSSNGFQRTFPSFSRAAIDHASSESAPTGDQKSKIAVPAITVTSSLAVVLGLFAGLVWLTRKFGSRAMNQGAVPKEVLQ